MENFHQGDTQKGGDKQDGGMDPHLRTVTTLFSSASLLMTSGLFENSDFCPPLLHRLKI